MTFSYDILEFPDISNMRVVENVEVVQVPICRISLSLQWKPIEAALHDIKNTKNKQTAYGPSTKEEEKRKKNEDEEKEWSRETTSLST